jgi:hypothetical protein
MADEKLILPDFFKLFSIRKFSNLFLSKSLFDWFINQLIKQKFADFPITHLDSLNPYQVQRLVRR